MAVITLACAESPGGESVTTASAGIERTSLDVQGHRGARGLRPENTLPSFEAALDLEVSTLELDLHFTADAQVVVWHDPYIDPDKCRLDENDTDRLPVPGDAPSTALAIRSLTAEELSNYICDLNPDPGRFPDQVAEPGDLAAGDYSIVTLETLLGFVERYVDSDTKSATQRENAEQVRFNVETKRRPDDPGAIGDGFDGSSAGPFELEVLRVIAVAGVETRTSIQSFDHRSLSAIRAVNPEIALAALTGDPIEHVDDLIGLGATIWSPRASTVTADLIQKAHDAGLTVVPWTINEPDEMTDLVEMGVDGLITDRPDLAISLR